jgi:hypothetical protein
MLFTVTWKQKNKNTTKWSDLEAEVKTWITDHTNNFVSVSTRSEKIAGRIQHHWFYFVPTPSLCCRFMQWYGPHVYLIQHNTNNTKQVHNSDLFNAARIKSSFELSQSGNTDPVPLTFKVPYNKTVDIKSNTTQICGHKKTYHTAVLACCADGTEMSPLCQKQFPRTQLHKKCLFMSK